MRIDAGGQRGLTLIELVVALSIFAVLGLMAQRALTEVITTQLRLEQEFGRWRALGRGLLRIETELLQLVAPGTGGAALGLIQGREGETELRLLRMDAELGSRRVGYLLAGERLEVLRWRGREAVGEPDRDLLLEGVRSLRWRFLRDGETHSTWPAAASPPQASTQTSALPDAVILELDLAGVGRITRIVALH